MLNKLRMIFIFMLLMPLLLLSCNSQNGENDNHIETEAPVIEVGRHYTSKGCSWMPPKSVVILTLTDEVWRDIDSDIVINVEFGTIRNVTLPEFSCAVLEVIESDYCYEFNYGIEFPPFVPENTGDYREEINILRSYRFDDYADIPVAEMTYDNVSEEYTFTAPLKISVSLTGRELTLRYGRLNFILWVYDCDGNVIGYYTGANCIPFVISEEGIVLCGDEQEYYSYKSIYEDLGICG